MATKPILTKTQDEDVLEVFLYPKCCYTMNPDSITETLLNEEINNFNEIIQKYTKDYIWHRDSLVLYPKTKQALLIDQMIQGSSATQESSIVPYIYASLHFDEDVGDEWFVVFLVFTLTELFNGLIARLVDSDGEFLLIETANYLPSWAEPETCQDRVYIYDGRVHVVQDKRIPIIDRLKRISENAQNYQMSNDVQGTIKKRIGVYPDEIEKRKHKARAFLPEKAAYIFSQEPGLISAAIRMIVHSDSLERKVCRAMKYFPPEQRVMTNVMMTKCLYAMASHCRYTGDPRTGWNFPPATNPKYNAYILGIKIACGLEMLVARANQQLQKNDSASSIDSDQYQQWTKYYRCLEASGYFTGTLEGSKEREKLIASAKEYLMSHPLSATSVSKKDDAVALKILEAWKNAKTEDNETQDESSLSPPDDDSWLNVDPAQLEAMLGQHWGTTGKNSNKEPSNLKDKIKTFLNKSSNIEGVKFSGGESLNDDDDNDEHQDIEDGKIDFDPDVFDNTLRDILDLVVPGGDGEFDGSSEGSLGGEEDDEQGGEMDKYMKLLDSQLGIELVKNDKNSIESNLLESMEEEAGGAGPAGNIIGGPIRRLMHLQLQSPTTVPPDLQS
ncbi:protein ecdysoneless [Chelonus insularis]|uniref:protein ecdysoneless n=1 Tax=Chelonus insularis TaxID=460826 RepID=UPI0015886946|nr:protein ecdysoneless [Chelonus insularis]